MIAHLVIHFIAHSALRAMQGMFSMAWNRCCFCAVSLMYVSSSRLYISAGGGGACQQCIPCIRFQIHGP